MIAESPQALQLSITTHFCLDFRPFRGPHLRVFVLCNLASSAVLGMKDKTNAAAWWRCQVITCRRFDIFASDA